MPGMLHEVIHNWSLLITEAARSGRVLDADLDMECWDRAVAIYFGCGGKDQPPRAQCAARDRIVR